MLTHQRQGPMECVPTSVAMLLDIPAASVIEAVMPDGCKSWERLTLSDPKRWWEAVEIMLDAGFGPGKGSEYKTSLAVNQPQDLPACPPGRGLLSIVKASMAVGHCVAFADGMIYDPSHTKPMTWREWKRSMPGWLARAIIHV